MKNIPSSVSPAGPTMHHPSSKTRVEESLGGYHLWRCAAGNQWTSPNWIGALSMMNDKAGDNQPCEYSGCSSDHLQKIVGLIQDSAAACAWFKRREGNPETSHDSVKFIYTDIARTGGVERPF